MNDALISWVLPTTRESTAPLDLDDIQAVLLSISSDLGANWSDPIVVTPPELSKQLADLAIGGWLVRLVVVDTKGKSSKPVDTPFVIEDDSPPGTVTEVTIVLS